MADEIETAGDVLQYGVPAVGLAATAWLRDGTGFKQFVGTALVAETWVWTLKLVVDEKRPSGGGRGFPSGHSATAALGAGFVHRRYGLLPALPLYGLTGFVGWSRHDAGAHRTLDIVAGIAIGMGTAMVIGTPYEEELSVAPMLLRNGVGARLALRF
ncbi:MAG: phosphatase PAP2 family protein [Myxococcota bacterium]|nr:phosphatase PAP2 family protein [Myxococcota bacterium]